MPELTLAGMAMAYGMGADYLEIDLVLTKDGEPILMHDLHLENTTNVREIFPKRNRLDRHWHAIDLTLEEIRQLAVNERVKSGSRAKYPEYPQRFPVGQSHFSVPTFREVIELVLGLNKSTGRQVGLLVELKSPKAHQQMGLDLEKTTLDILEEYGLNTPDSLVIVQSFDQASMQRLRFELEAKLPIVQLIGGGSSYNRMVTPAGLDEIATYAQGIGPTYLRIVDRAGRLVKDGALVSEAQARELKVFPYTLRQDALPSYVDSLAEMVELFLYEIGVTGVIIDHPDVAVKVINN